jgi:hypothetical protein
MYQDLTVAAHIARDTLQVSRKAGKAVREASLTLKQPNAVTETVNGVDKVVVLDFGTGSTRFLIPYSWTPTQVNVLVAMHANALLSSIFGDIAEKDEFVW